VLKACVIARLRRRLFDPEKTLPCAANQARAPRHVADGMIKRVIQFARQGYKEIDFPVYDTDWIRKPTSRYLARTPTTRYSSKTIFCARWKPTATGT